MTKEDIGIVVERKSALATVTIARPDRLNAFNQAMFAALGDAARALSKGTLPRAVRSALKVIRAGRHLSLQETLDLEQQTAVDLIASGECLHGIGAFLTGQPAIFPDLLPDRKGK